MKLFYNHENDSFLTEKELKENYFDIFENGETDASDFEYYIHCCTDKNGTLDEITYRDIHESVNDVFHELEEIDSHFYYSDNYEMSDKVYKCITLLQKLLPLTEKLVTDIVKTPTGDEA